MNREDIIHMARVAAAKHGHTFKVEPSKETLEFVFEFHAMATSAEREACASIVENADTPDCGGWTACGIAAAIRARKDSA